MARSICGLFNFTDFDCPAYSLVDSQKKNKLESKSKKCIFIGFTKGVKGFRLWDLKTRSAFRSLTKKQCYKKSQRQRIKRKVELQTVR